MTAWHRRGTAFSTCWGASTLTSLHVNLKPEIASNGHDFVSCVVEQSVTKELSLINLLASNISPLYVLEFISVKNTDWVAGHFHMIKCDPFFFPSVLLLNHSKVSHSWWRCSHTPKFEIERSFNLLSPLGPPKGRHITYFTVTEKFQRLL